LAEEREAAVVILPRPRIVALVARARPQAAHGEGDLPLVARAAVQFDALGERRLRARILSHLPQKLPDVLEDDGARHAVAAHAPDGEGFLVEPDGARAVALMPRDIGEVVERRTDARLIV